LDSHKLDIEGFYFVVITHILLILVKFIKDICSEIVQLLGFSCLVHLLLIFDFALLVLVLFQIHIDHDVPQVIVNTNLAVEVIFDMPIIIVFIGLSV